MALGIERQIHPMSLLSSKETKMQMTKILAAHLQDLPAKYKI